MRRLRYGASGLGSRVLISSLVCLLFMTGCSFEEEERRPADEGRLVRRFVPFEDRWISESEIPAEPQETPLMVIWEVSEFPPGTPPTPAQQQAADELEASCYRTALEKGWFDFRRGLDDGFQLMFQDRRHYENRQYMLDDRVLDPERPEFLMYYGTPKGKQLIGFMFYVDEPLGRGPQVGGNRTIWHYHIWKPLMCLLDGLVSIGSADSQGRCELGEPTHRSPEMLHVWLIDHPDGPFTTSMMIEPMLLKRLIAKRDRERPETARP